MTATAKDPRLTPVIDEYETERLARDMARLAADLIAEGVAAEQLQQELEGGCRAWFDAWPGGAR